LENNLLRVFTERDEKLDMNRDGTITIGTRKKVVKGVDDERGGNELNE